MTVDIKELVIQAKVTTSENESSKSGSLVKEKLDESRMIEQMKREILELLREEREGL